MSDLNIMESAAFDTWLSEQSRLLNLSDDELLVEVVSRTLRDVTMEGRARGLLDVANLCMLMADRCLGSNVSIATCLTIVRN